jgi:predicted DCC family thiol-disulfide oxidoreductase YuxK
LIKHIIKTTANIFSIDLRSLAVLRIGLGLLILADLFIRGSDLSIWLSDGGVLPRDVVIDWIGSSRWSFYFISGSWLWSLFLFGLAGLAAIALILGFRTRWATLLSFVMLISLHNRTSLALQGGDNLLLLLVFWSLFLPLGARLSMDAALIDPSQRPSRPIPNRYVSMATAAILLQAMSVYFFSAFLKSGDEWYQDGTAIYYALHIDDYATWFAHLWRDQHWLTVPLSRYVWWLELIGPLLIFSPWLRVPLRLLIMFAFISMEIGFIFNLHIGLFPLISILSILLFTPTETWDALEQRFWPSAGAGWHMYYDQDCGFCLKMCWLLKTFLGLKQTPIIPAQSDPEIAEILEREFSWVVVTPVGERLTKWSAMVGVFSASPWLKWLAPVLAWPNRLGNKLYDWVAVHRGEFGRWFALLLPWGKPKPLPGLFWQIFAGGFLIYILAYNVSTVPSWRLPFIAVNQDNVHRYIFPADWKGLKRVLRLDQKWNMFAPYPRRSDSYLVVPGILASGKIVDVYHLTPDYPDFAKPEYVFDEKFKNYRWRKYIARIGQKRYRRFLSSYGGHLCRRYNSKFGSEDPLTDFIIYKMVERTPAPGLTSQIKRKQIWRHWCIEKSPDKVTPALKAAGLIES